MNCLGASVLALLMAAISASAGDLTLTYRMSGTGTHNKAEQYDAQGGETITQYITPSRARVVQPYIKSEGIFDFDKGIIYTIDHKRKVITKMTAETLEQMGGMLNSLGFGGQGASDAEVKVEETGSEVVLGRPCKKVKVTLRGWVEELSLDPTLQFPVKYRKFMDLFGKTPGEAGAIMKKMGEALLKYKGVPLRTHLTGKNMNTTHEAISVSTAAIPASTFDLPKDYRVEDMGGNVPDFRGLMGGRDRKSREE